MIQVATGEWFHTPVRVRQGYLLSPTLFNIFLEDIMTYTLDNYNGTMCTRGCRNITNVRFAAATDGVTGADE